MVGGFFHYVFHYLFLCVCAWEREIAMQYVVLGGPRARKPIWGRGVTIVCNDTASSDWGPRARTWVRYLRLADNQSKSGKWEAWHRGAIRPSFSTVCRMLAILQSPVAYNLQHLREYSSCRIWASQSRRPPYVAEVEGRARIEGVAASIHESYVDAHGNKVAGDAVFKTPCVVIIFDEAPQTNRLEVQSKPESKHLIMKAYRDRGRRQAETWEETRPPTRSTVARQGRSW